MVCMNGACFETCALLNFYIFISLEAYIYTTPHHLVCFVANCYLFIGYINYVIDNRYKYTFTLFIINTTLRFKVF